MKKNKILKLIFRLCIGVLSLVLIVTLPFMGVGFSTDFSYISGRFIGAKSKYQGIIEVWNIDTFESGTNPKVNYLNQVSELFQRQNKGLYVLVRNLTEYECMNLLEKGERPDIFSCSYGIASQIKNYIKPYSNYSDLDVQENLIQTGIFNGDLYGLAWCLGVYCFISTETHLKNAKYLFEDNIKLSDIALNLGYKIKTKNGTKIISSLTYGSNKYLLPKTGFSSYTNKDIVVVSNFALDKDSDTQSQYTAYSKFIAGECVMLLGTQRDIARMENRVKNGKISKVFYEQITSFTDLIQFSFLAKNDDVIKSEYCEKFAKFLTKKQNQKNLSKIGMFPVTGQNDIYDIGIMSEISLNLSGFTDLKKIF